MVACSRCSANFKNKPSLRSHLYNYHKGRPSERNKPSERINPSINPYPKKMYKCPKCDKKFDMLAKLYSHKSKYHNSQFNPSIRLINHNHENEPHEPMNDDIRSIVEYDNPQPPVEPSEIPQPPENYDTINSDDDDKSVDKTPPAENKEKRKRIADDDSEISFDIPNPIRFKGSDEIEPRDSNKKNIANKYKVLYQKCVKQSEKWKKLFTQMRNENITLRGENKECANSLINHQDRLVFLQANIVALKTEIRKCKVTLTENQDKLVKNQADIVSLKEERKELKRKVDELNRDLDEEHDEETQFNSNTKKLFNCVTIEEIEKIRRLFKHKKVDRIKHKSNIKVIQKIAMGLIRGYIPVCNPQRTVITNQQRDLIENIEKSTTKKAEKLIGENIELVSDFMSKVDGSIKMVVQLYDKYGSRDEDTDNDSQDNSSDDSSDDENKGNDADNDLENSSDTDSGNEDESRDNEDVSIDEARNTDNDGDNESDDATITNSNNDDTRSTSSNESL